MPLLPQQQQSTAQQATNQQQQPIQQQTIQEQAELSTIASTTSASDEACFDADKCVYTSIRDNNTIVHTHGGRGYGMTQYGITHGCYKWKVGCFSLNWRSFKNFLNKLRRFLIDFNWYKWNLILKVDLLNLLRYITLNYKLIWRHNYQYSSTYWTRYGVTKELVLEFHIFLYRIHVTELPMICGSTELTGNFYIINNFNFSLKFISNIKTSHSFQRHYCRFYMLYVLMIY